MHRRRTPWLSIGLVGLLALSAHAQPPEQLSWSTSPLAQPSLPKPSATPDDHYLGKADRRVLRWADQTRVIRIHIEDGRHLPGWRDDIPRILTDALSQWAEALNNRFAFAYLPRAQGCDVRIRWQAYPGKNRGAHAGGQTQTAMAGRVIVQNDITLTLNRRPGQPVSRNQLYAMALHEAGHMLGIQGHSPNPSDVMTQTQVLSDPTKRVTLSQRDINTIRLLYSKKPYYTNPEGITLSEYDPFANTRLAPRGQQGALIRFAPSL